MSGEFLVRLRKALEESGLRQKDFAERAGITAGYLTDILKGRTFPSDKVIRLICAGNKLNEEWLREGRGEMFAAGHGQVREPRAEYGKDSIIIDRKLLTEILEGVEQGLSETGLNLAPEKRAQLIMMLCDLYMTEKQVDKATVIKLIRLAA